MASIKAMKYEKQLLQHSGTLKEMVLRHLSDNSQLKQDFLIELNNFFDTAHVEARKLRKALAFLHNANEAFKKQLTDAGIEPNENYGREDGQSFRS